MKLTVSQESWPMVGTFRISRGSKTEANVVVVRLEQNGFTGWGECVPYPRYGESATSVMDQISDMRDALAAGLSRKGLIEAMPAGAGRNALDAALWDLEAKSSERGVVNLGGFNPLQPLITAYTIGLDSPEIMAEKAGEAASRPLLKVKLGGKVDMDCINAVRVAAPDSRLIVDANEGWSLDELTRYDPQLADLGVEMIEQPLPAREDGCLEGFEHKVALCADESCHTLGGLEDLCKRYDMINIKLDKTGGLTHALELADAAEKLDLTIMVGCMVGTSLAMAPAFMVAQRAEFVDLDGPLLLANDRDPGFHFEGSLMHPPEPALWG